MSIGGQDLKKDQKIARAMEREKQKENQKRKHEEKKRQEEDDQKSALSQLDAFLGEDAQPGKSISDPTFSPPRSR